MYGDQLQIGQGGQARRDGVLALRAARRQRAHLAAAVRAGELGDGGAVGGASYDDDMRDLIAGGEGGERVGQHGASGEGGEQLVAAAHARAAAGRQQHAAGAHGPRSGSGWIFGWASGWAASAAKSIRPAWVWMTRFTTTSRVAPSASAASSTTTIVPSGR